MRKLRVLHLTGGLAPGGKERQLIEIARNIDQNKYTIGIVTFNTNNHYSGQARELSSYYRELVKRPTRLEPLITIWKCFREFKPDIIHTWDSLSSFYVWLPSLLYKIPVIDGSIRDAGVDKGLNYHFKRFFLKRARIAIGNSFAGLKAYKTDGEVIYNVIDNSRFISPTLNGEFNLLMTANFSKYKDHFTFLKAAVQLVADDTVDKVFLLGDGEYKEKYLNWINHDYPAIKDRFIFTGAVRNVEEFLAACKVGVLCSTPEFSEGVSNSVLEYMSAGLVPIATNLGGIAEIIEDGQNGYLINPGDDKKIVDLIHLIKNDTVLYDSVTFYAKQTIASKFSMTANLLQLTSLYNRIAR